MADILDIATGKPIAARSLGPRRRPEAVPERLTQGLDLLVDYLYRDEDQLLQAYRRCGARRQRVLLDFARSVSEDGA